MQKNTQAREQIIQAALELFNTRGYAAVSIQDIMEATGLTKGSIYRRFSGKEDIAIAAFEYSGEIIWNRLQEEIRQRSRFSEKLMAFYGIYSDPVYAPVIRGGCPMLNTATQTQVELPRLHAIAASRYRQMLDLFQSLVQQGIACGEFRGDTNAEELASLLMSAGEGAIMASRLLDDNSQMKYNEKGMRLLLKQYRQLPEAEI